MVFTRFNAENPHNELCEFEEWDRAERKMGVCGQPASGQVSIGRGKKQYLCAEHFDAGSAHLHKTEIKEEKKRG